MTVIRVRSHAPCRPIVKFATRLAKFTKCSRLCNSPFTGSAGLLCVPSAIVPETFNVLLNPAHQDAKRIVIVQTGEPAGADPAHRSIVDVD
jgi:hypothetical protein